MFEHDGNLKTRMDALEMMSLAEMDLRDDALSARTTWSLAKGWLELLLDWSDEQDSVDMTHVSESILAVGSGSNITVLEVDGTSGSLTAKGTVSGGVTGMTIDASTKFLYANSGTSVQAYSIDTANGTLTAAGGGSPLQ